MWDAKVQTLTSFASRVWAGFYKLGNTVGVQTVQVAICTIGKMCELKRGFNPTYCAPRQYIAPLKMQVEGFQQTDPIPVQELAVPVAVSKWFAKQ